MKIEREHERLGGEGTRDAFELNFGAGFGAVRQRCLQHDFSGGLAVLAHGDDDFLGSLLRGNRYDLGLELFNTVDATGDLGAFTIGLANNPGAPLATGADLGIVLDTGPELISGSTRLKAGTAQKIALNAFSSAVMVRLHKVYGNLMIDVRATNAKLVKRALRLTVLAAGCSEAEARRALGESGWRVKVAVVMLKGGLSVHAAEDRLEAAEGSVHGALAAALAAAVPPPGTPAG